MAADDVRAELPGAFEQPHAFLAGHPLVGHQQTDVIAVLLQQFQPIGGIGSGKDAELVAERPRKHLQRLRLVIHVEDGKFLVVV
jgi:hypothetical protein